MAEINPLPLVVPLLFLVVLKLCDIAREINLEKTQGNAPWDVPLWSNYGWGASLPSLGRFNYIHFINYFLLLSAFYFTLASLESGTIRTMLLVFILLIWALLPIFEVQEYDNIPPKVDGEWPSSFRHHYLYVFFVMLSILVIYGLRGFISNIDFIPGFAAFLVNIIVFPLIIFSLSASGIEGFLSRLDDEISDANLNSDE